MVVGVIEMSYVLVRNVRRNLVVQVGEMRNNALQDLGRNKLWVGMR
jgi:hypothetical protein